MFLDMFAVVIDIKNKKRRPARDDERQARKMIMGINSSTKLVLKKHILKLENVSKPFKIDIRVFLNLKKKMIHVKLLKVLKTLKKISILLRLG